MEDRRVTTALGKLIRETVFENTVQELCNLPDWKFCIVFADGLYNDACAGCHFEGTYYTENEIYAAYMRRYPDAEPLV